MTLEGSGAALAVPLLRLACTLHEQMARVQGARMIAGSRSMEWDLVFPPTFGMPLDGSNVTDRLQAALREAGLSRQRFHDLRHCCATLLLT